MRVTDRTDWFTLWFQDKESMIEVMTQNMVSDLKCGYDYFGNCITKQRDDIEAYKNKFDEELEMFKGMDEKEVNRWCFYDMKKRGAIA
mgnify:CR=1 FL=1